MSKIISIHSFGGGTGKSNLIANLAVLIALQGKRVAIIDTDLQSPGIHALFNINEHRKTLNDYLWNHKTPLKLHQMPSHRSFEFEPILAPAIAKRCCEAQIARACCCAA